MASSGRLRISPSGDASQCRVRMVFDQSLRGLEAGATIDLLGIELGAVRDIAFQHDTRSRRLPLVVTADLYPKRMGRLREEVRRGVGNRPRSDARLMARLVEQSLPAKNPETPEKTT